MGNLEKTGFGCMYNKANYVSLREVLGTLPYLTCLCITEHANDENQMHHGRRLVQ